MKSVANCRTGNQNPNHESTKGDSFQELTCEWRSRFSTIPVEDLNKKLDNYRTPIDHSPDSKLGTIQTQGRLYDSYNRFWSFSGLEREWNKKFDHIICYCTNKDGTVIERIYIFPKEEIIKRTGISIVKNPTDGWGDPITPWYEKYRVTDKEIIKEVNEIWKDIIKYKKVKKAIKK